jgi:hypothetical protein
MYAHQAMLSPQVTLNSARAATIGGRYPTIKDAFDPASAGGPRHRSLILGPTRLRAGVRRRVALAAAVTCAFLLAGASVARARLAFPSAARTPCPRATSPTPRSVRAHRPSSDGRLAGSPRAADRI